MIYPINNNNVIPINHTDVIAGDICVYDSATDSKKFFRFIDSGATDDITKYSPIGVVVIPTSHNVYSDGSCGVMSLKPMNSSIPATGGTSEQSMYWGVYGTDISTLPNLDQVPVGNTSNGIPTSQTSYAIIPSDKFSGTQCAHDTDAYYYSSSYSYAPSPYLTDGSRNPGYYQTTSPSSSNNALADFDGRGNTDKIITQRGNKEYTSWKPGSSTEADYPAASCCDMFYTEGTQQGDWYLPACGELGYIMPPFNKINEAITKMRNAYGSSVGVTLDTNNFYWSSSEYSSYAARYVDASSGRVNYSNKSLNRYVRAWLRVSPIELVDLGLPSGILWAKCNLGANSEEEYGKYYAWGETEGYTVDQIGDARLFDTESYKFTYGVTFTKYNINDSKSSLDLEDDAAYTQLGSNYRIPSKDDFSELLSNTEYVEETINGIKGFRFNSKINNNSIFLPAAGFGNYSDIMMSNISLMYSTNNIEDTFYKWIYQLEATVEGYNPVINSTVDSNYRTYGYSIRPIYKP